MQFADAIGRLRRLPASLPPPPRELTPVLLPGPDGHVARPDWPTQAQREAAVLLLVYPDEQGEAHVVLTDRPAGGHRHAGQVSLPGGAIDPGDESVVAAALREAREEVGLDAVAEAIEVLGQLPPFDVRASAFLVHPVVASAPRRPALRPDPREVAAILHAPLATFLPGAPIRIVTAERDGLRLRYGAFPVGDHLVWGATAHILGRVGAFLSPAGSASVPR